MSDRPKHFSKRVRITTVACVPCQNRKSKCDGSRPVCAACLARNPDDCVYDAAGDQRRTTALKMTNERLDKTLAICNAQVEDLKEIIRGVCRGPITDTTAAVLHTLVESDFNNLAEVAAVFRGTCEGSAAMTDLERSVLMNKTDLIDPSLDQASQSNRKPPSYSASSSPEMPLTVSPLGPIDYSDGAEELRQWV